MDSARTKFRGKSVGGFTLAVENKNEDLIYKKNLQTASHRHNRHMS